MIVAAAWNESAAALGRFASENGYDWVFGEGPSDLARQYRVLQQSSKVGIDAGGVIVMREGYGNSGAAFWRGVLNRLRE